MPDLVVDAHDRRLLQAIDTLLNRSGGRSPTLSEIAVALGYMPSSRANIQRRLAALRPLYVTQGAGSRSLRLTAEAFALLGAPPASPQTEALSDDILRLLASGLTWLASEQAEERSPRVPYRDVWQRALNRFVCACLERQVDETPTDATSVAQLCQQPLGSWPVRFGLTARYANLALLADDEPTPLCRELALDRGDAEEELTERMILPVLDLCRMRREPDTYVAFRSYLIEHPVVELADLLTASLDPALGDTGRLLLEMYEQVPALLREGHTGPTNSTDHAEHAEQQGVALLCPVCGWTLTRTPRGTLACGDARCRERSDGFRRYATLRFSPTLYRVRRAIRRYIVAPGRYEVDTAKVLRTLRAGGSQLRVDLWPSYDEYDLRITFPDGEVWAVDVKDWRFPALLARTLVSLRNDGDLAWTRAFYVIPDERLEERPDYLAVLAAATPERDFELCTVDILISRARERLIQGASAAADALE